MDVHKTLKEVFGFSSFRPGQEEVVNLILKKQNLLAGVTYRSRQISLLSITGYLFERENPCCFSSNRSNE